MGLREGEAWQAGSKGERILVGELWAREGWHATWPSYSGGLWMEAMRQGAEQSWKGLVLINDLRGQSCVCTRYVGHC